MKRLFFLLVALSLFSCKEEVTINKNFLAIKGANTNKKEYYQFVAKGGERHLSLIDWGEESIPTSSKSCHHGGEIVPPLRGFIQASYDDKNIYLHVSWKDLTKDDKKSLWKKDSLVEGKDDGISIVFSKNPSFNCALTCHMTNWEIDKGRFVSDYRMFNEKEENPIILIKSAKTNLKAIAGILNKEGKKNFKKEDFFIFNSKRAHNRPSSFYLYQVIGKDDDAPVLNNKELFLLNDNNYYIEGEMQYRLNEWVVKLTIPLDFLGLKNIKKDDKIFLSLAIFDGTNVNHSITETFYGKFE